MAQILGWQDLHCDCGRGDFTPLVTLRGHINLGLTVSTPTYQCIHCKRRFNSATALNRMKQSYMEAEIESMKVEIDSMNPVPEDDVA